MKFSSFKKITLLLSLLLLVLLVGYVLFFNAIKKKNEEVSVVAQNIEMYANKEAALRGAEETVRELGEGIDLVHNYFLKKDNIVSFIELVEEVADKSGLTISIKSVGTLEESTPSKKASASSTKTSLLSEKQVFAIRADAEGTWSDLMHFIVYMEHVPHLVAFNRVSVNRVSSPEPFFSVDDNENATEGSVDSAFDVSGAPLWSGVFEIHVTTLQ